MVAPQWHLIEFDIRSEWSFYQNPDLYIYRYLNIKVKSVQILIHFSKEKFMQK